MQCNNYLFVLVVIFKALLYLCIVIEVNALRKRILKVKHKYIKIKHHANK